MDVFEQFVERLRSEDDTTVIRSFQEWLQTLKA
jgi:hypothetical protein